MTTSDPYQRQAYESNQDDFMVDWAQRSSESSGRKNQESADDIRGCYQRDRDRILHSRAFRRMKFKTQVFIEPVNDDTRSRLTHTLEVMQIARTIARSLKLNEDLVEAMALGHDIGHTPFAHVGESVLDELTESGFHHSRQSLRVADQLARRGEGLNLTKEVKDGIAKHSKSRDGLFESVSGADPVTAEGMILRLCDSIAYLNHDIDDAIQSGYLHPEDLPQIPVDVLGDYGGERIDTSVRDIIEQSRQTETVTMSDEIQQATDELRDFMFENLYLELGQSPIDLEARKMFGELYDFLSKHPSKMYAEMPFLEHIDSPDSVADFLSLQSDLTTIQLYRKFFDDSLDRLPTYDF